MEDLILLKQTFSKTEDGEITIKLISPLSTVELTTSEDIAQQIYTQLGTRFLDTIESELQNLKFDMES